MAPVNPPIPPSPLPPAWFYADNGAPRGPYNEDAIAQFLHQGTLTAQSVVWCAGAQGWLPLAQTPLARFLAAPTPPAIPLPPPAVPEPPPTAPTPAPVQPSPARPAPGPATGVPRADGIIPLTVQPGSDARSSFSALLGLLNLDSEPDQAKAAGGAAKTGIEFWTPRLGETILGGLLGRGIEPRHFDWLMPLAGLELADNRSVANGYCGLTTNGMFHVCFHRPGEGFYYAAMPAKTVMTRAQVEPTLLRGIGRPVFALAFPPASGLRTGTSPALAADLLDGLTAGWLAFWQPAILAAWGKDGKELALARLARCTPEEEKFGVRNRFADDDMAFFRPGPGGLEIFPEPDFEKATLQGWSISGGNRIELLYREPEFPEEGGVAWRFVEHVPAGAKPALPAWVPTLDFGAVPRSETLFTDTMASQGGFETLWEGETEPVLRLFSRAGDTIALEGVKGVGRVVFERGGFVEGTHALAVTADGRCARLVVAGSGEFKDLAKFNAPAAQWGTWKDGTTGCGVFLQAEKPEDPPLPARLTLSPEKFSVGPFLNVPLRANDSLVHTEKSPTLGACEVQPGASTPGQPAPKLTILLPTEAAVRLWEEWDVAHALSDLSKANVGGFYRGFNEAKKLNLLAVLFSDVIMLNQALDKGTSMEDTIEKLEDAGPETLAKDTALRNAVVAKILALVQTLPGIKQKLELMASMYPYYWVHQEVEWLKTAFGAETAAGLEESLRKRTVPLVRREVRTIQGNLSRALAEIESAARPVDGLLSRNEIRKDWKVRAKKYLPIGVQGASAIAMIAMSHGTYGWTGLSTFLASGVLGNVFEGMTQDAESVHQIGRAAQAIFPWWRVFLSVLVTTQFEFGQFVDDENLLAMKRDRALLEKVPEADKKAATARLVAALRTRIVEERRGRFAEVLAGSGVRMLAVVNDLENTLKTSARQDVDEFIKMLRPGRGEPDESENSEHPKP